MNKWRSLLLLTLCGLSMVAFAAESESRHDLVGRADADASGNWPLALWVREGQRSHFIVRAPREMLGGLPGRAWRPADAEALMSLERFGAPRVVELLDINPCPGGVGWSRFAKPAVYDDWPGEHLALRHPPCGAANCVQPAWRIDLPSGGGDVLPLARLLPGLSSQQAEWLVLYAVTRYDSVSVAGVRALRIPEPLRFVPDNFSFLLVPGDAMRQFPAIDAALLEHAARSQRLQDQSALMRLQRVDLWPPWPQPRWDASAAQREALGLTKKSVEEHHAFRLQLRLLPHDRPRDLRLRRQRAPMDQWLTLTALAPEPVTPESCRSQLAALNCDAACEKRVVAGPYGDDLKLEALPAPERPRACKAYCEQMKQGSREADMASRFAETAANQAEAWRLVEKLTGRSAASWQSR